jgi:hypothetical protein
MMHPRSARWIAAVAAVVLLLAGCSASETSNGVSQDVGQGLVPDEVAALIDQWWAATATSVVDLYTPTGFHLYGARKITGDDIGTHLANPAVTDHEELTPLLLVVEEPGRRYVVTQGIANTIHATKSPSGLSWEILADSDGTLRIAQSAWLKISPN